MSSGESSGYQPSFGRDNNNSSAAGGYQPTFGRRRPNFLLAGPVAKDPPLFPNTQDVGGMFYRPDERAQGFELSDRNFTASESNADRNVVAAQINGPVQDRAPKVEIASSNSEPKKFSLDPAGNGFSVPVQETQAVRAEPTYQPSSLVSDTSSSSAPAPAAAGGFKFKFGAKKAQAPVYVDTAPPTQSSDVAPAQSIPTAAVQVCPREFIARFRSISDHVRPVVASLCRHRPAPSRTASHLQARCRAGPHSPIESRARYGPEFACSPQLSAPRRGVRMTRTPLACWRHPRQQGAGGSRQQDVKAAGRHAIADSRVACKLCMLSPEAGRRGCRRRARWGRTRRFPARSPRSSASTRGRPAAAPRAARARRCAGRSRPCATRTRGGSGRRGTGELIPVAEPSRGRGVR